MILSWPLSLSSSPHSSDYTGPHNTRPWQRWSDGSAHLSLSPINQLQSMIPWNTALYETHNTIVRPSVSDFMHVMCHVMWLCHKIKQRFSQSDGPNPCIGYWTLNICFHFLIMHQASQYFFLTITPIKWFSPSLFINWSICTPYNQINISEKMFSDQKPSFIKGMISDCLDLCRLLKVIQSVR